MALQVQAPTRRPRQGGIKAVVGEFVTENRLAAVPGGATQIGWEDSGCGFPKTTRAGCYDDVVADAEKIPDGVEIVNIIGDPFARYKGVECWLGGDTLGSTYEEQARTAFEQGEDREVEEVLVAWAAAAATPGAATSVVKAIGVADDYADENYVGQPVMLMSRDAANEAFAGGALAYRDGVLVTAAGTPVISTGAFPAGVDDQTVMAIGMPAVYASDIIARMAIAHAENLAMAIAERVFAIGVDCEFRYAVLVTP